MKTEAKSLVVRKDGEDYTMEIPTHSEKVDHTEIPLKFLPEVKDLAEAKDDSISLGCDEKDLDKAINQKEFSWGDIVKIKNFKTDTHHYYLLAEGLEGSVRVGPLHKGVDGSKIDIDFENLQWVEL